MCNNPTQLEDGTLVSCRRCNDCLNTRKVDWVSRAMAESAVHAHTLALTLTYANKHNGKPPVGALTFDFVDFQNFMKRLRKRYRRFYNIKTKQTPLRYLVVGEKGSTFGRVHYHLILWSNHTLAALGTWEDARGEKGMKLSTRTETIRLDWDLWPHGFVEVQETGEYGVSYVCKYILKDFMSIHGAKGTARETRSENYAASLFRQSRKPAIGDTYLEAKLEEWRKALIVPPSLQLKVPGLSGYWHPVGRQREKLCQGLHAINQAKREAHGRDCSAWSTLLATLPEQPGKETKERYDLEHGKTKEIWWPLKDNQGNPVLNENGEEQSIRLPEQPEDEAHAALLIANELAARQRDQEQFERKINSRTATGTRLAIHRHCLGKYPCERCLAKAAPDAEDIAAAYYQRHQDRWEAERGHNRTEDYSDWYARQGIRNPFCRNREKLAGYAERHKRAANVQNRMQKAAR